MGGKKDVTWVTGVQPVSNRLERFRRLFKRERPTSDMAADPEFKEAAETSRVSDSGLRPPFRQDQPVIESDTPVVVGRLRHRGQALRQADRRQRQREAQNRRERVETRCAVISIPINGEEEEEPTEEDTQPSLGSSAYRRVFSGQRRYSTIMLPESDVPPHLLHGFVGVGESSPLKAGGSIRETKKRKMKKRRRKSKDSQDNSSKTPEEGDSTEQPEEKIENVVSEPRKKDSRYFQFDLTALPTLTRSSSLNRRATTGEGFALRQAGLKRIVRMSTWMQDARLQKLRIWDICFPGTHNSASWELADQYRRRWSTVVTSFLRLFIHCQSADIYEQLCCGIRFLDIRVCKHIGRNGEAFCAHGGFRTVPFRLVLEQISLFCYRHPTEVILMSVRRDVAYRHGPASIGVLESDFWVATLLKAYLGPQLTAETTLEELVGRRQQVIYFFEERERFLPKDQQQQQLPPTAETSRDTRRAVAQSLRSAGELSVTGRDLLRTKGNEPDPSPALSPSAAGESMFSKVAVSTPLSVNSGRQTRAVLMGGRSPSPTPSASPNAAVNEEPQPLQHFVTRWVAGNFSKFGLETLEQLPDGLFRELFGTDAHRTSPDVQRRWEALHSGVPAEKFRVTPPPSASPPQTLTLPDEIFSLQLSSRRSSLKPRATAAELQRSMVGRKITRRQTVPRRTQRDPFTGVLSIAVSTAVNKRLEGREHKETRKFAFVRRCDSLTFVSGRPSRYLATRTAMAHRHDTKGGKKKKRKKQSHKPQFLPFPEDTSESMWDATGRREFAIDTHSAFVESGFNSPAALTLPVKVLPKPPVSPRSHYQASTTLDNSEESAALPTIPAVRALGTLLRCDSQLDASIKEMLRSYGVTADAVIAPTAPEVVKRCISSPEIRQLSEPTIEGKRSHSWHPHHTEYYSKHRSSAAGATQPLSQVEYDLQREKLEQQRRVFLRTGFKDRLALDLRLTQDEQRPRSATTSNTPEGHKAPPKKKEEIAATRAYPNEGILRADLPPLDVLTPFVAGRSRILKSWGQTTDPDPMLLCRKLAMWTQQNGGIIPREPFIFKVLAGEVTPPSFGSPDGSIDVLRFWTMQGASALMLKNGGLEAAAAKTHKILLTKYLTRSLVSRVNGMTHDYVNENVVSRIIKYNLVGTISRDELDSFKRRHTETQ